MPMLCNDHNDYNDHIDDKKEASLRLIFIKASPRLTHDVSAIYSRGGDKIRVKGGS